MRPSNDRHAESGIAPSNASPSPVGSSTGVARVRTKPCERHCFDSGFQHVPSWVSRRNSHGRSRRRWRTCRCAVQQRGEHDPSRRRDPRLAGARTGGGPRRDEPHARPRTRPDLPDRMGERRRDPAQRRPARRRRQHDRAHPVRDRARRDPAVRVRGHRTDGRVRLRGPSQLDARRHPGRRRGAERHGRRERGRRGRSVHAARPDRADH